MGEHGTPDWAEERSKKTVYGGIDLAEHAARLGSPVTFDRRGDVIFYDTFEQGLSAWRLNYTVPADKPNWSSEVARTKGFSCKLHTSATTDFLSYITRYMAVPVPSKIGLEFSFTMSTTNTRIDCSLLYYNGTTRVYYNIRYNQPDSTLEYYGSDDAWHVFATNVKPYPREYAFNTLKLVVDLEASIFTRAILNSTTYDLSSYLPSSDAFVFSPYLQIVIKLDNPADAAKVSYIDDVIVTQNEP